MHFDSLPTIHGSYAAPTLDIADLDLAQDALLVTFQAFGHPSSATCAWPGGTRLMAAVL